MEFRPQREELIEAFRHKTTSEVAEKYGFSDHVIRKWVKSYGLTVVGLQEKLINKSDVLNAMEECENDIEKVAEKLNITIDRLNRLIIMHSIEKIPSKKELEKILKEKSKEELAVMYKTTRTTLRKWITAYNLNHIRCKVKTNRKIIVIKDGIETEYDSIKEVGTKLKMSANTIREKIKSQQNYQGFTFKSIE